jgi:hypothetical protein
MATTGKTDSITPKDCTMPNNTGKLMEIQGYLTGLMITANSPENKRLLEKLMLHCAQLLPIVSEYDRIQEQKQAAGN